MAQTTGRPEDRFSSGLYWIFAVLITAVAATIVSYMLRTTGDNIQKSQNLTMPMIDNSGQTPASK